MTINYKILNEEDSFAACLAKMPPELQKLYAKLGHNRAEPIFIDRIFYIYKCTGKGADELQRPAEVLAKVRVVNFGYSSEQGFTVSLLNETTNEKQMLTVIPGKVFGYDIFASVPCSFTIKFNQILWDDGRAQFDTSIAIYVKTANKADFFSYRNIYMETPKRMQALYPNVDWAPDRN